MAFAAELRTRATAQPEPEGHPPVKAGSRETTSEQEAAEVPSTLWQVLRHLEEGRKEERRLLVETLGGGIGSFKYRELKGGDDIEHYLLAFERAATTARIKKEAWVVKLAPFLTGKALAAYANMAPEEACNYDCLKDTILKRYNISEETYRQRFRSCRKQGEESYQEHASRLRDLFSKWIQPKEKTVEQVSDLLVMEQLMDTMPKELQIWLREQKPKTLKEASGRADDYAASRKLKVTEPGIAKGNVSRGPSQPHQKENEKPSGSGELGVEGQVTSMVTKKPKKGCFQCGQPDHFKAQCPQLHRPRKTRKQRREAGKGWLGRPGNTPEGQGGTESQKATDPQPGEGTRDLEERLPAGIPRTIGADELKKLQADDPSLTQVRRYAEMAKEQAGEETGFRWADGVLYRQWKPRKPRQHETVEQIVLPAQCRQMVMKLAHDRPTGGHLGRKKTRDRVLQHFYWPNVFKEVAEYCKSCDRCQKTARVKASEHP